MKRKTRILALASGLMAAAAIMFIGCTLDVHDNPTNVLPGQNLPGLNTPIGDPTNTSPTEPTNTPTTPTNTPTETDALTDEAATSPTVDYAKPYAVWSYQGVWDEDDERDGEWARSYYVFVDPVTGDKYAEITNDHVYAGCGDYWGGVRVYSDGRCAIVTIDGKNILIEEFRLTAEEVRSSIQTGKPLMRNFNNGLAGVKFQFSETTDGILWVVESYPIRSL